MPTVRWWQCGCHDWRNGEHGHSWKHSALKSLLLKDYARFLLMLLQKADLLGIVDSLSARESLMVSESFSMNLKGVILVPMSALNAPLLGSRRSVLHLSCGPNNSSGGVLSAA